MLNGLKGLKEWTAWKWEDSNEVVLVGSIMEHEGWTWDGDFG